MTQQVKTGMPWTRAFVLCLGGLVVVLALAVPALAAPRDCAIIETRSGAAVFRVEVVDTPEAMSRGLMWRTSLREDHGMLFVYDPPGHASFWMKNTLIPLDMVFIAVDGRVHRIAYNARPLSLESIPSGIPVRAVLEIAAGVADKLGVRPGDRVHHPDVGDSLPTRRMRLPAWCR